MLHQKNARKSIVKPVLQRIAELLPVANPDYSPLKRFEWGGEIVTINAPFFK